MVLRHPSRDNFSDPPEPMESLQSGVQGEAKSPLGKTVEADGRDGGTTKAKAYNGINSRRFYQTPVESFQEAKWVRMLRIQLRIQLEYWTKKGIYFSKV